MNKPSFAIAITATRQSGKDTLCASLCALNFRFRRHSFADALKEELYSFLLESYGVDIWSCSSEEKELVRPILIAHGMCKRAVDPLYWVKKSIQRVEDQLFVNPDIIPVWQDCRFENEAKYLREHFAPSFAMIDLIRNGAPPPTDEEEKHFREVAAMADYHLVWGNDTVEQQLDCAREVLRWIGLEETK